MSVRIMTQVWALDLPDSDKLVLLALADCANDEGHCWPSVRSLIAKCSKSERTIQGSIKRLVDEGLLVRREVPGKGCNYTVLPSSNCTPAKSAPPQGTTQTPAAAADKPSRTINTGAKAPYERVVDYFNEVGKREGWSTAQLLDASRKQTLRLRIKSMGEDQLLLAVDRLAAAKWVREKVKAGTWKPDLDYLLRPATLRKLIEGTFTEETSPVQRPADEQRKLQLGLAEIYERQGRTIEAAEIRRKWETPSLGSVAKILVGKVAANG